MKNATRKIGEIDNKTSCNHPQHNPPTHQVFEDGIYEHECPLCGRVQHFTVSNPIL